MKPGIRPLQGTIIFLMVCGQDIIIQPGLIIISAESMLGFLIQAGRAMFLLVMLRGILTLPAAIIISADTLPVNQILPVALIHLLETVLMSYPKTSIMPALLDIMPQLIKATVLLSVLQVLKR